MKNRKPVNLSEAHCLLSGAYSFLNAVQDAWAMMHSQTYQCESCLDARIKMNEVVFGGKPDDIATLLDHIKSELENAGFLADPPKPEQIINPAQADPRLKKIADDFLQKRFKMLPE